MVLISSVVTPAVAQLPLPILSITKILSCTHVAVFTSYWTAFFIIFTCVAAMYIAYGSEKFQKVHRYR